MTNYACITCFLYCASDVNVVLRRSRSHDSRLYAMSYIKTSSVCVVNISLNIFYFINSLHEHTH